MESRFICTHVELRFEPVFLQHPRELRSRSSLEGDLPLLEWGTSVSPETSALVSLRGRGPQECGSALSVGVITVIGLEIWFDTPEKNA